MFVLHKTQTITKICADCLFIFFEYLIFLNKTWYLPDDVDKNIINNQKIVFSFFVVIDDEMKFLFKFDL